VASSAERYPVSFDSDPGRDDGSLPPVDVVIPDDARELARDVLAYRREMRSRRRHERMLRFLGPLGRAGFVRNGGIFPLIASCVALSLLAGTMLSVVTISPASAPTTRPSASASAPATVPAGVVKLDDGQLVQTTALDGSVLALIPYSCDCGSVLKSLAVQAKASGVGIYFVYYAENTNVGLATASAETNQYGDGIARTVFDFGGVFFYAYAPYQLTALLVDNHSAVAVVREFPAGFDLTPGMKGLRATH
jgi:hypothetical protein